MDPDAQSMETHGVFRKGRSGFWAVLIIHEAPVRPAREPGLPCGELGVRDQRQPQATNRGSCPKEGTDVSRPVAQLVGVLPGALKVSGSFLGGAHTPVAGSIPARKRNQ